MKSVLAIFGLCCAVAVLSPACGGGRTERPPDPEYLVYDAFLSEALHYATEDLIQMFVIPEDTDVWGHGHDLERALASWATELSNVEGSTLRSFANRNKTPIRLRDEFHAPVPVTLISKERLETLRAGKMRFHEELEKAFPGGYGPLTLSRVGFNENGTQALFYSDSWFSGDLHLLTLNGDQWILKESTRLWTY
jgi:hypothetical protein